MSSRKGRKRSQVAAARKPAAPPPKRSTGGSGWMRAPRSTWSRIGMAALLPALALAIALGIGLSRGGGGSSGGTGSTQLWGTNTAGLASRLQKLGLPGEDGGAIHIHQHLDVYVNGRHIVVPADIGLTATYGAPLHTHDTTGVIHLESPVIRDYTLGDFFGVWGLRLTKTCLGNFCNNGAATLHGYLNGKPVADPASMVLAAHQEIVVAYGTQRQLPKPIPSAYRFGSGL